MGGQIGHHTNLNAARTQPRSADDYFHDGGQSPRFRLGVAGFSHLAQPGAPLWKAWSGALKLPTTISTLPCGGGKTKAAFERVADYPASSPIKESLFVVDPDGNTVELCIRKQPSDQAPNLVRFRYGALAMCASR